MSIIEAVAVALTILCLFGIVYALTNKSIDTAPPKTQPKTQPMSSINIGSARSGRSLININGMAISMEGGRIYVNGLEWGPLKGNPNAVPTPQPEGTLTLEADGTLKGPFKGEIHVQGHNVTLTITGDVHGYVESYSDVNIQGNVTGNVDAGNSLTIGGNVGADVAAGNSATIQGDVAGNVNAGNSVDAASITGNVDAGGNVTATTIQGNVDAGGNVIHR